MNWPRGAWFNSYRHSLFRVRPSRNRRSRRHDIGAATTTANPDWTPACRRRTIPNIPPPIRAPPALGELLRHYHGTEQVTFTFDSTATGTSRTYAMTGTLAKESKVARIYGGMHFRYASVAGAELGKQVAAWTMQHAFSRR